MIKSLSDRIKVRTKYLKTQIKEEKLIEGILDLFREIPLWAEIGEENMSLDDCFGWWWTLFINVKIDVQEVEDTFCRAIRQKYGSTWEMEVDDNSIILETKLPGQIFNFNIKITNPDIPGCNIIKIPIRTLTDKELEAQRIEYQYLIQCNGGG